MNSEIQKIIEERIKKLPSNVVVALENVPWMNKIKNIAEGNNFDKERGRSFMIETTILILGIESPMKYLTNLAEKVRLNNDAVVRISEEVDKQIITPILKMVEKNESATTTKETTNVKNKKNEPVPADTEKTRKETRDRVSEISEKYGLDENQTGSLVGVVRSVISKPEEKPLLLDKILQNLKVSRLLAEQIMSDLEKRIFSANFSQNKERPNQQTVPGGKENQNQSRIPEIAPKILPVVEKNESVRQVFSTPPQPEKISVPNYAPVYKPNPPIGTILSAVKPIQNKTPEVSRITYTSSGETKKESEDMRQEPVDTKNAMQENQTPENVVKNELKSALVGTTELVKTETPQKKYSTDPYREPIN